MLHSFATVFWQPVKPCQLPNMCTLVYTCPTATEINKTFHFQVLTAVSAGSRSGSRDRLLLIQNHLLFKHSSKK